MWAGGVGWSQLFFLAYLTPFSPNIFHKFTVKVQNLWNWGGWWVGFTSLNQLSQTFPFFLLGVSIKDYILRAPIFWSHGEEGKLQQNRNRSTISNPREGDGIYEYVFVCVTEALIKLWSTSKTTLCLILLLNVYWRECLPDIFGALLILIKHLCAACGWAEIEDDQEKISRFSTRPDWHFKPSYCRPHLHLL